MDLSSVVLSANIRASVNYAKAREAIDHDSDNFKNRHDRREAKMTVIEHLKGKKNGEKVEFDDGSRANY